MIKQIKATKEREVVYLPFFPGFYESMLSCAIDRSEEQDAEYMAEKEASEKYYPETYQPEHLRISASEYAELFFDCTDYQKVYLKVAQFWVEAFDWWCKENLGTPEGSFKLESILSPREYNFTTDRVFAYVPESVIESLFEKSKEAGHRVLAQVIKERYTSYDGFISFYSNELEMWLSKPLEEWDHNELMALVEAAIRSSEGWEGGSSKREEVGMFQGDLYERVFSGNGEEDEARDSGMDWPKFEEKVAELRVSKLEAYEAFQATQKTNKKGTK